MKVFYVKLSDGGIDAISLVETPAFEENFLCFEKQPLKFSLDNTKHVITGVICLADTPIYRFDNKHGEYYVVFTKETIEQMVQKFAKDNLFKSVNLQHDDSQFVDGIYMFESYLVNKERGIIPVEFPDIPDGSWIGSYKVENEELWEQIVNGTKLNGFSLQGMFQLKDKDTFEEWLENQLKK